MLILSFEALHDFIVGLHSMAIFSRFEGGYQDRIRIRVKSDHEILVATASLAGEPTCIISIQFADRLHYDMEIILAGKGRDLLLLLLHFGHFGLGRTDSLMGLH